MLLVDATVGPSSIHGLGLISRQHIPAGAAISKFEPRLDLELTQAELDALPAGAKRTYRYYSFRHIHSRNYVLSFDDDRFTNHCDDPNTNGRTALRDILPGEELTYDYRRWDLDCEWKLASTPASFETTLRGGEPLARLAVLRVISEVGLQDDQVVPHIASQLRETDRELRYYAAKSLAGIDWPRIAPAAAELCGILADQDRDLRYYAAKCLSRAGPDAPESLVPALVTALNDSDPKVRYYCVKALGAMRDGAGSAIDRLRTALRADEEPEVREAAAHALGRLEGVDRRT